jgi:hypothetical protein
MKRDVVAPILGTENLDLVPLGIIFFLGIITSKVRSASIFTKAMWLPFPRFGAYSKPADFSVLINSLYEMDGSFVMK